jgi:hypothetical protein
MPKNLGEILAPLVQSWLKITGKLDSLAHLIALVSAFAAHVFLVIA